MENAVYLEIDVEAYSGDLGLPDNDAGQEYDVPVKVLVELKTGRIVECSPARITVDENSDLVHMKVCDSGIYNLLDANKEVLAYYNDYVPDGLAIEDCGWGDYIIFKINPDNTIKDWNGATVANDIMRRLRGEDDE